MTLARWKDLCFDADDVRLAADFWGHTLGLRVEHQEGGDAVLRGSSPAQTTWVNRVPEPKTVKNRVHLDLVLPSVEPLLAAGATVLHAPDSGSPWHVLADPEGNELCVFRPAPDEPTALVVDAGDPVALAAWWADVLGARPAAAPDGTPRWVAGVAGLPFDVLKFVAVPEPKTVKNRWHLDVVSDDVTGLVARGARVLREPDGEVRWHVLADPEGNEFCAFAP